jgi:transcriptional regulator with XRE-family HTH domain
MNVTLKLAILSSPLRTQIRLGASAGIGEARVSRIVNGWSQPTDDERKRIAEALNRDAAELFPSPSVA